METKTESPQIYALLPNDLLHKILCLLPLRTLFDLRSVCRQWRSLPFSLIYADFCTSTSHARMLAFCACEKGIVCPYDKTEEIYETYADTRILDITASGLLLLTLQYPSENRKLKLFVYNPACKNLDVLPPSNWASRKLSIISQASEFEKASYKVYSLGRTECTSSYSCYLYYGCEAYDSALAAKGWQILSHVNASLGQFIDTHIMCHLSLKAICNGGLGVLYWVQPSLEEEDQVENGPMQLLACNVNSGTFYQLPRFPFDGTFVDIMWPCVGGLQLACGVANEDDQSLTCAVEIWELHQGKEDVDQVKKKYGFIPLANAKWQVLDRIPHHLWEHLTNRDGHCKIACAVSSPLVFVIADEEKHEKMVVYNAKEKTWKIFPNRLNLF